MFPHFPQILRATYYASRWRLKKLLGVPHRHHQPVVAGDSEKAYARHLRICQLLATSLTPLELSPGFVACEIGSGDCLAGADLLLSVGAQKVYLVEKQPIITNQRQQDILQRLADHPALPNEGKVLTPACTLNPQVAIIPEFFENAHVPEALDLIFSFDVLEHVEDLKGFFERCAQFLKPGGQMIHKFDLSGHEYFEDPMPPLDFQIYPDWLYYLMFPPYRRAVRHFADQFIEAIKNAGFEDIQIRPILVAEADYLRAIRPHLRSAARTRSDETLALLDLVVTARKPAVSP